jgi:hypothetical protein
LATDDFFTLAVSADLAFADATRLVADLAAVLALVVLDFVEFCAFFLLEVILKDS